MIMNKTVAIDTNVLVYCHSYSEPDKQEVATGLFAFSPVISTQVLSEYLNVVKRKLKLPKDEIMDVCMQNLEMCKLQPVGFTDSHSIKNYKWIFKRNEGDKGYVFPRK